MPCKICPNYRTADNSCAQSLNPEKVQASGKCSWLNKFFGAMIEDQHTKVKPDTKGPFKKLTDPRQEKDDSDRLRSDPNQGGSQSPQSEGGSVGIRASKIDKNKLKDLWG
jgi:hypothetical protein